MPTIEHILCPIDFSETSTHAAEQAVAIAGLYAAHISARHVCMPVMMPVPDEFLPEDPLSDPLAGAATQPARDRIAAYFGPAKAAGIRVDVLIDLIVLGVHGRRGSTSCCWVRRRISSCGTRRVRC